MALRTTWTVLASTIAFGAVLAIPSSVLAYRAYRDQNSRTQVTDYLRIPNSDGDAWLELPTESGPKNESEGEADDPRRRMMQQYRFGRPHPGYASEKLRIAREEAQRWAHLFPGGSRSAPQSKSGGPLESIVGTGGVTGLSWMNIGPTDALFQWNGTTYLEVDSGRAAGMAVDPRDPEVVYLATSGGGVWKTFNFSATNPDWFPLTDMLGNIAIGAMAMDPIAPDTLYVGIGDAFDLSGGQMVKTTNGGATWSVPVGLSGTYPAASGGVAVIAKSVRAVTLNPVSPNVVLVTTDVGLFQSTDSGATYALIDLPNAGATQVAESTWSVQYLGTSGGNSRYVVSGVYACRQGVSPPRAGWGVAAGAGDPANGGICTVGNLGDIWYSSDSGTTWSSARAANKLAATGVGRITLAAGAPKANPATTVVYAQAGNTNEGASAAAGLSRSLDGGATFTDVTGTVANATTSTNCQTSNIIGQQAWYNQAIAVDPGNDANVLIGGIYCGLRTTNGNAGSVSWTNVSHWLPSGGGGNTSQGALPYVHADWHRALIVTQGSVTRAFAGTDGGLFVSDNLFTAANGAAVTWRFPNRGIVTHLSYSVASGDPASGNPLVAFTGMQDNGTRFRDSAANPTTFNQVIGGDGIGASASTATDGSSVYWGAVNGMAALCVPSAANSQCNLGGAWDYRNMAGAATHNPRPVRCGGGITDAVPFFIEYAVSLPSTANHTHLTHTNYGMFKSTGTAGSWSEIGSCFSTTVTHSVQGLGASEKFDGLYGAAISGGRFAVTADCTGTNTNCSWSITQPVGVDLDSSGTLANNERVLGSATIAFAPGGAPGQEFIVGSVATLLANNVDPVSPQVGHIFKTIDGGLSWTRINGFGTASPLPNVPVNVVRYDTSDLTNNTLYAGTDLGVYRSTDGGANWERFGFGMPLVKVTDMFVGRNGQILRVSTFGRGLWEIYPSATAERGVAGNGDYNRDQQIDIVDLAASASRLGTNTLTTAQPYYDWNMDLVAAPSTSNAIEEPDLSAVLGKFGGRP